MRNVAAKLSVLALVFGAASALGCASSDRPSSGGSVEQAPPAARNGNAEPAPSKTSEVAPYATVIHGRVTNFGAGSISNHLAGASTLSNAASVKIVSLQAGGKLEVVGNAEIDASGGYSLQISAPDLVLIAQAVNAAGEVLGSAIIGATRAGIAAVVAPITTTTSLEAELLIRLSVSAQASGLVDLVPSAIATIHGFVDDGLSAAIAASIAAGADFEAVLSATADAVLTAQSTLTAALVAAGANIDAKIMAAAQFALIASFNASLDAGATIDVAARIVSSLAASTQLSVQAVADALVSSSVAFQASIQAKLDAAISASAEASATASAAIFAAMHAAAKFEAGVVAHVTESILRAGGVAEDRIAASVAAGLELVASVAAAVDFNAIVSAKATFRATLMAGLEIIVQAPPPAPPPNVFAQLLGAVQQAGGQIQANLQGALSSAQGAAQGLIGAITAAAGNVSGGLAANIQGTTQAVLDARAQYLAMLQGLVPQFSGNLPQVQVSAIFQVVALVDVSVNL